MGIWCTVLLLHIFLKFLQISSYQFAIWYFHGNGICFRRRTIRLHLEPWKSKIFEILNRKILFYSSLYCRWSQSSWIWHTTLCHGLLNHKWLSYSWLMWVIDGVSDCLMKSYWVIQFCNLLIWVINEIFDCLINRWFADWFDL